MVALSGLNINREDFASTPVRAQIPRPVADNRGRRRLREADKDEIVRRYVAGEDARTVAEELGFAKSTVLRILRQRGVEVRPWGVRYR
ncbi:helix-turn-helix domain-containing protein [Flexivirga caeni]|uniref:Resolvase HTH domain-containing protein n=1 Tax=Flexivirga caeni TaxID=2294115 RepID=A0A3M9M5C3_9MICO|nr:helix-turn-helix domain-containing protein [Flexivirga caeni]RNI20740.1 hypothetical protein EFY87_14270 [Flexivirga caeni]